MCAEPEIGHYMSVQGSEKRSDLGVTLSHEHVLVDFIGAKEVSRDRYDPEKAFEVILPYLQALKDLGCETFIECTPSYIGRDPRLLRHLSRATGLRILSNTGYYGARNNHFLPPHAFTDSAEALADRWVAEFTDGMDGTDIKPGFIKIGVDGETLSEIHRKLVQAAALTHAQTGLTIASHTGKAGLAFEQMDILEKNNVSPGAFIWVHAQAENESDKFRKAAQRGCWISLDGFGPQHTDRYSSLLEMARQEGWLNQILISHDAGWYSPGEPDGGDYRDYNSIFKTLQPALKEKGFTDEDIRLLMVTNPAKAFRIQTRFVK